MQTWITDFEFPHQDQPSGMSQPGNLEVNNTRCRELIDQPKQGSLLQQRR